jgi:DNA invertase Pin-like site-specific DNA recombinase
MTDHLDGLPTGLRQSSTVLQDLTAQREILTSLGVSGDWIYLDKGLTGTNRARPGPGSGLGRRARRRHPVVPKLDRLARSVPPPATSATLWSPGASACLWAGAPTTPPTPCRRCSSTCSPCSPSSKPDLLKMRTREGMAIARSRGKLKGKQPKLSARQQAELVWMHATGEYTIAGLMEVFSVGRATIYRVLDRTKTTDAETPR